MRNKLHVSHHSRVPETQMHGQRYISRRPWPSIHTQLQTTAEDNIQRQRTCEISSDNPSPPHHLGSRVVNKCTVLFKNHERDIWTSSQRYQSRRDSTARNTVDDQTVETTRTLHGVRAMRCILRHPVSGEMQGGVSCQSILWCVHTVWTCHRIQHWPAACLRVHTVLC